MLPAASSLTPSAAGLALGERGVIRSASPMKNAAETMAKLARTKERLYVASQLGGWGTYTLAYLALASFSRRLALAEICIMIASNAVGLLISHLFRGHIKKHGWLEMNWKALLPRLFVAILLMSVVWTTASWPLYTFFYNGPLPQKLSLGPLFLYVIFNGGWIFGAWAAFYFIYHIFERLQRMQVEQLHLAAVAKEAELRALKSQVNPHFLFNSLNSLRALIDEDAPRARESVTRLANMLRYSLQSGQLETVPLEDEVRIVEDYLALEMIRHESRLRVRWAVGDDSRTRGVPPMLLQTLVENAVKYGISPRREGGEISIETRLAEGALHIRVTNPGNLSAPVSHAAAKAGSSTGVGLRNAAERLKLLYGEKARLELTAEPAGCVTARVAIPLPAASR